MDFENCSFVVDDNTDGLEDEHYLLNDLAAHHQVRISEFTGSRASNKPAV